MTSLSEIVSERCVVYFKGFKGDNG